MQDLDGTTVYSATDLVGFLACEHLTTLDRVALTGAISAEDRVDEELDVLRERGEEHERRYLADLESRGHIVVEGQSRSHIMRLIPSHHDVQPAFPREDVH